MAASKRSTGIATSPRTETRAGTGRGRSAPGTGMRSGIERAARRATLTLEPFGSLPRRWSRELRAEAEAMLRFMEEDASTLDLKVARG